MTTPIPDSPIRLRAATEADVADILRCIRALADYERLADECMATESLLRDSLFGPAPAAEVVLAQHEGTTIGFALWFRSYSTFLARPGLYLEDLFVFPEWRGRGVGRRLLAHLGQIAVARGYGRVEWAVLDWNVDAIRFYESLGARPMSEWTTYRVSGDALASLASAGASAT